MKKTFFKIGGLLFVLAWIVSCTSTKEAITVSDKEKMAFNQKEGDTITIANEETEYQIIIIESGFNFWLQSIARPEGYYSQSYLENRNQILVTNWNIKVNQSYRQNAQLYELRIDYNPSIDYGYEVNYKLYNYFVYFQRKYNQRLGPWLPRA